MLSACQPRYDKAREIIEEEENSYEHWHTLKGESFTARYPEGWLVTVKQDSTSREKLYELLPRQLKRSGVEYIVAIAEYQSKATFQVTSHAVMESLSSTFGEGIQVFNNVDFTFKSLEANHKELKVPTANGKVPFDVYLIKGVNKFYLVMYNRAGNDPQQLDPLFHKILYSLNIAKAG